MCFKRLDIYLNFWLFCVGERKEKPFLLISSLFVVARRRLHGMILRLSVLFVILLTLLSLKLSTQQLKKTILVERKSLTTTISLLRPAAAAVENIDPPPPPSSSCPQRPFHYLPPSNNKTILLASFPGSGNTWMRYLIEHGTGYLTGTYEADESLISEFPGEVETKGERLIVQKTHFPCPFCFPGKEGSIFEFAFVESTGYIPQYEASVHILRDPLPAILSLFHFLNSGANHTGLARSLLFQVENEEAENLKKKFKKFVETRMDGWLAHTGFYLNQKLEEIEDVYLDKNKRKSLLVRYENLVSSNELTKQKELRKMFDFLSNQSGREFLSLFDPVKATECALRESSSTTFKRVPFSTNPYLLILQEQNKTMKDWACERLSKQVRNYFSKTDWTCSFP